MSKSVGATINGSRNAGGIRHQKYVAFLNFLDPGI